MLQDLTGNEDTDECRSILQRHSWNIEVQSVNFFLMQGLELVLEGAQQLSHCKKVNLYWNIVKLKRHLSHVSMAIAVKVTFEALLSVEIRSKFK